MTYRLADTASLNASSCVVQGYFKAQPEINNTPLEKMGDCVWESREKLVVHCGLASDKTTISSVISRIVSALKQQKIRSATICLPKYEALAPNQQIELMLLAFDKAAHPPEGFKTQPKKHQTSFDEIQFFLEGAEDSAVSSAFAIAEGVRWTRHLANLPANHGTPSHIAEEVLSFEKQYKQQIKTRILEREDMQSLGMGAFLAIAQGSHEPPKLIEIKYQGAEDSKAPIVLVGKGITFDSGGISLKPAKGMHEMKYDMGGAASVLGAIKACALQKLPINVIGLLACSENMPSSHAVKPGDVVTSMLGKTIEITNTDAEGRMVLCDTLTYAEQFNPEFVIDVATLTGAIIVSLGRWASGFMTQDDELARMISEAGEQSQDFAWRMPLNESYQKALESPVADLINASMDGEAGSITAACFLSHFTKKFRWAHIDIAGTAWQSGKMHNSTGRPVPLLMQLLRQFAHAH